MKKLLHSFLLGCLIAFSASAAAHAATPSTEPISGIALTPALQDKVLGVNDKTASFTVQLTNQTSAPLRLSLSSTDFTSLNQTGGLTFLGSDSKAVTEGNGLSNILQLSQKLIALAPGETKPITATVPDVSRLAPGGHYTAVLAQVLPDGSAQTGNKVTINQVVSSLIFLETAGKGSKTLELLKPQLPKLTFTLPGSVNVAFKATGNTQTVPRGLVTLSHKNKDVATGIINENSSLLLPGSTRLLPVDLSAFKQPLLPGRYSISVQYRYEQSLGITTYETQILYINLPFLLVGIGLVVIVLFIVVKKRSLLARAERRSSPAALPFAQRVIVVKNRSSSSAKVAVSQPKKSKKRDKSHRDTTEVDT